MINDCATAPATFPDQDWADGYRHQHQHRPARPLFDPSLLRLPEPPSPEHCAEECERLLAIKPLRASRLGQIRRQAQSEKHAIQPVLDVLGINFDRPPSAAGAAFRKLIQDNIWGPIFVFKKEFDRRRPWNACGESLEPMFMRPDRLYPGHPSYPSGHATMAYAWAYLLGHFQPLHASRLLAAAGDVAFNREVAGVHFHSDTHAGQELGRQMAELIAAAPDFDANGFRAVTSV